MCRNQSQQGITIYLSLLVLGVVLAAAIGLSTVAFFQIKGARSVAGSVAAFYVAESGIEAQLHDIFVAGGDPPNTPLVPPASVGDGDYAIRQDTAQCSLWRYCIESNGNFEGTRRAIRVRLP